MNNINIITPKIDKIHFYEMIGFGKEGNESERLGENGKLILI